MNDTFITPKLRKLRESAIQVAKQELAPRAEEIDRAAAWPEESVRALGKSGLLGLHVDKELGGRGEGLLALALVTEQLGRFCSSTALVYGMHCVASKVIQVKATEAHRSKYLRSIARGEHVTSLALSEPGTGVHIYLPRTRFSRVGSELHLSGSKSFVTSGGYADSYVLSVVSADAELDPGTFSCVVVDRSSPGLVWGESWAGFGMRGNSSRRLELENAVIPAENFLGEEGDESWYLFEIIAPYFIVAMAGTYLGIARAALETVLDHLKARHYRHSGDPLGAAPTIPDRIGHLWTVVERAANLIYCSAAMSDEGLPEARLSLLASKAEIADAVVYVTNEAMTLTGGIGYGENSKLARLLRDARASHVMSPTTDLVKSWLGRMLLDLPLL